MATPTTTPTASTNPLPVRGAAIEKVATIAKGRRQTLRPGRRQTDIIAVPPDLKDFAAEVLALGYILQRCVENPNHPGTYDVDLLAPITSGLPRFTWESEHGGWKPTGSLSNLPSKLGMVTTMTIKQV